MFPKTNKSYGLLYESLKLAAFLVLAILPVMIIPVFAQTSDTFVFVQNILRDSNGNLVATHEVTKIGFLEENALRNFLDEEASGNDPVIAIGGQNMQIIERAITLDFDSSNVLSDTTLNVSRDDGQIRTLVRLIHDGIPVTAGDQITTIWTFIRPV